MAISASETEGLKKRVREVVDLISASGFQPPSSSEPAFYVWDEVRTALGKSYKECNDEDIPRAFEALKLLKERIENEAGR